MNEKKVAIETIGCRFNRFESAEIAHELSRAGFITAGDGELPDVIIINTCTVTDKSDAKCRAAIRRAKAGAPDAVIVVAGCYAEMNAEEVARESGVRLVVGNLRKLNLAEALAELSPGNGVKIITGGERPAALPVAPITSLDGRTNAYVKIQSGCDEVCSFCVVRFARGKSISAAPDDIIAQIREMERAGIREAVLTGINIGEYEHGLVTLIRRALDETGIERIRLSSINPNHVTEELIDLMASSQRLCKHLHIPLQSGSSGVLLRMKRPYTPELYEMLLRRLDERLPGIGIGADVMVGFPGETDAEFEETRSLIERSPLMMLHVFAYSPREGTEAYSMSGAVPKKIAKTRSAILKKLSAEKRAAFGNRFIGHTLDALVENTRDANGMLKGFTDNYLPVIFAGGDEFMNRIVPVRIVSWDGERACCEIV